MNTSALTCIISGAVFTFLILPWVVGTIAITDYLSRRFLDPFVNRLAGK